MDERYREEIEEILRKLDSIAELRSQAEQVFEALGKIAEITGKLAVETAEELHSVIDHLKPLTFEEALRLMPVFAWVLEDAEKGKETDLIKALLIIFSMGRAYEKYREIHGKSP